MAERMTETGDLKIDYAPDHGDDKIGKEREPNFVEAQFNTKFLLLTQLIS